MDNQKKRLICWVYSLNSVLLRIVFGVRSALFWRVVWSHLNPVTVLGRSDATWNRTALYLVKTSLRIE